MAVREKGLFGGDSEGREKERPVTLAACGPKARATASQNRSHEPRVRYTEGVGGGKPEKVPESPWRGMRAFAARDVRAKRAAWDAGATVVLPEGTDDFQPVARLHGGGADGKPG